MMQSCDDVINPSAPFEPRMVVYCVLNSASDTQFVRIYTTYNPTDYNPALNPEEQVVSDATVSITDGSKNYTFAYRAIPRPDSSRYKNSIGVYFSYPFRPQASKNYTLIVTTPTLGQATAQTSIPGRGFIATSSIFELEHPVTANPVTVRFSLHDQAKAYLVRFYVVYTTENPGDGGREHYYEVPLIDKILDYNLETHFRLYPSVITVPASVQAAKSVVKSIDFAYPAYNEAIYQIVHYNFNVRFKRAVFYLIQFNEPWYKHYASGNLFQDRLGVRLDPPDYSNIQGGVGLFGGFHVDSTVVPLPEYIRPYRCQGSFSRLDIHKQML